MLQKTGELPLEMHPRRGALRAIRKEAQAEAWAAGQAEAAAAAEKAAKVRMSLRDVVVTSRVGQMLDKPSSKHFARYVITKLADRSVYDSSASLTRNRCIRMSTAGGGGGEGGKGGCGGTTG